jgi:hypothetical protein
LIRSAANFVQFADSHRCHGTFYKPRDGLRTVKDLQKEIEEIKQGKEEDPLDYNMFGDKKLTSDDAYYYSDRSAGKGYRDFANGVYDERPYVKSIAS